MEFLLNNFFHNQQNALSLSIWNDLVMLFIFPKGFYPIRKWKKVTDVWKIIIFKKLAADVVFGTKRKKSEGVPF